MRDKKIFIIDDDKGICLSLSKFLETEGYETHTYQDPREALQEFLVKNPQIVLLDLKMPHMDGLTVLERLKSMDRNVYVVMMTAYATLESTIEALRRGANDYLLKPFKLSDVTLALERAEKVINLERENIKLKEELKILKEYEIVGESPQLKEVLDIVKRVSSLDVTVIIYGESGTGKELIARAIHFNSPRKDKPFIPVNIAALPEELVESELFGYKKGAFTGATTDKEGIFKACDGGTIFLDEIAEASPRLQAKLLRVIEYKKFTPLGSTKEEEVDVRIIAATNKNLFELVKEGKFREDLYYRLNVVPIQLPPLRERVEDIPLLVKYFIKKYSVRYNLQEKAMEDEALKLLMSYTWPGNIRELENFIEHLLIVTRSLKITKEDVLNLMERKSVGKAKIKTLEELELDYIKHVLNLTGGNKKKASELLGIDLSTLYRKIKKLEGRS